MADLARVADAVGRDRVVYQDAHVILIHARWQDVIEQLPQVDAVIADPPFGKRTHAKQKHGRHKSPNSRATITARGLGYDHWTPEDVSSFVAAMAEKCGAWIFAMTSHDLMPAYEAAFLAAGRYAFAPVPCVQRGMNVRLAGDGPSNWTVYAVPSRTKAQHKWGTLPGAYVGTAIDPGQRLRDKAKRAVAGGKPLWLMRAIVGDYSREGDLILDPCAGGGTTGRAAKDLGRQCLLIERDGETCEKAARVLRKPAQVRMRLDVAPLVGPQDDFDFGAGDTLITDDVGGVAR